MDALCKPTVIAIGGPTATGKTALSVALARQFGGEIVCADSMQIYRGLDIGTAKVQPQEMQGVPHHLLDFLPPEQPYSVADFVRDAGEAIGHITAAGRLPLVVGGTGLYLSSLLGGINFSEQKDDPALRARLQNEWERLGGEEMYRQLQQLDPEGAAQIHPHNRPRVLRALEVCYSSGQPFSRQKEAALPKSPPYRSLCLILHYPDRAALYRRIEQRVDGMMEQGLLAEARQVYERRDEYKTAAQAIGYKEFFDYFEQRESLAFCVERLKQATRHYAKRQLTWFRRMEGAVWLDAGDPALVQTAAQAVDRFLSAQK